MGLEVEQRGEWGGEQSSTSFEDYHTRCELVVHSIAGQQGDFEGRKSDEVREEVKERSRGRDGFTHQNTGGGGETAQRVSG